MTLPRDPEALRAYLASLPDLAVQPPDGKLRFIEPMRPGLWGTPWLRLSALGTTLGVQDMTQSAFSVIDEEGLVEAVLMQTGLEDAPAVSSADPTILAVVIGDLLGYIDRGWPLVQYEVIWEPEWYREVQGKGLPQAPPTWISINAVALIKGVAARTVKEHAPRRLTARRCEGNLWFVEPNERLDRWFSSIPDWGSAAFRTCAVVAAAQALVEAGRATAPAAEVYALAEVAERAGEGVTGYYERHSVERYLRRHFEDPEICPVKDGHVMTLPETAGDWTERGPRLVLVARALRDAQITDAVSRTEVPA